MYFHKDVGNLTLVESALLAGMIQSPNPYNPYRHPRRATERRNLVIRAVQDAGFIEEEAATAALPQPLPVEPATVDSAEAPYFVDLVRTQLQQRYDARDLTTQNLSSHTSLDLRLQTLAQRAVANGLASVDKMIRRKRTKLPIQGCLIALEPKTGAILALIGGRSYGASQCNRVMQAWRQPGSTFKPFVYLAAHRGDVRGPGPAADHARHRGRGLPRSLLIRGHGIHPQNYEDEYHGNVTLRRALSKSLNVATVKVAEMVGYEKVSELWATKLGIGATIKPYPAVALGAFEATPFDMPTAYNVLANGGLKIEPVAVLKVTNEEGQTLEQHDPKPPARVAHEEATFLVTNMLRSVINEGTAAAARPMGLTADAAGKTGTTKDLRDAWFAGYTPDLLRIVWVGYDDNTPINLSGARAALPIWVEFMKGALAGTKPRPLAVPAENVISVEIDKTTGLLAGPSCPNRVMESFIVGTGPTEVCHGHDYY